ncbi:MAG: hypothetical protein KDA32_03105 [Phycisphaerales bacterium]|nr:hypothetical protein [Phycisphaerales bacterium]
MKLPAVDEPGRYQGLYLFDFGEWTSLGYTADEIAVLLEDPEYADGRVYKVHNATPDGRFELRGVSRERFNVESGMLFFRAERAAAEADYEALEALAAESGPPARAFVHLADRGEAAGPSRYAVALVYPAELDDEFGRWLLDADYGGGDFVEGGPSVVANYYAERPTVMRRAQLWSRFGEPRSADEIRETVRRAAQR